VKNESLLLYRLTGSEKATILLGSLNCTSDSDDSDSKKTHYSSFYASSGTVCGSSTDGTSVENVNKDLDGTQKSSLMMRECC